MIATPRVAFHLLLLTARSPNIRLSDESDADAFKKATEVDLGGAGEGGASALEAMQERFAKRLESMGASDQPPPPPPPPMERGKFTVSNAAATNQAAQEALYRMRRKETGELEREYAETIARAMRAAQQWLDAGLSERARSELTEIEKYMSFGSELGADFHLLLAKVAKACGQEAQAKRLWQRVMSDAKSSSQRWQAEQQLNRDSPGSAPSSPSKPGEVSNLFNMPSSWD